LLAEDNAINQKLALRLLQKAGYSVDVVENGLQAVNAVQKKQYSLVLMDVQMPELDGFDATRQIRALPSPTGIIPIVAMTAHALAGDREKCLEAGMNDYLSKPLNIDEVLTVVNKYAAKVQNSSAANEESLTESPNEPSEPALYDLKTALPRFGESEQNFYEFMGAFLTHLKKSVFDLENAISIQDIQKVQYYSHSIKGAAANFEISSIRLAAQGIEEEANSGQLTDAALLLEKIKSIIPLLEKDYQKNISSKA
jgi:CheY-like chemotaxis protein/HPt (histidine-containing phosphotransfer) domain-containing protein